MLFSLSLSLHVLLCIRVYDRCLYHRANGPRFALLPHRLRCTSLTKKSGNHTERTKYTWWRPQELHLYAMALRATMLNAVG